MLKIASGIFLLIGSMIGGGIFAIPIVSAHFGFTTTLLFIVCAWLVYTKTGLQILNLSLSCEKGNNTYYSIVGKYLGPKTQKMTVFLFLWILFFSLSSYISGCVSLIMGYLKPLNLQADYFTTSLLYTAIFGSLIIVSSKLIVRANSILVALKILALIAIIYVASPYYSEFNPGKVNIAHSGITTLIMITINAFGFQYIIPSLVNYFGKEQGQQLKWMLIAATSIVCLLYCAWLLTIYAVIPASGPYGLEAISDSSNQLLAFNTSLQHLIKSNLILNSISFFQMISMFGSFFCVGLGVFDFIADMLKNKSRITIGILTFVPPLLLSLASENMYIYAMSLAGYISIILEIIIPNLATRSFYSKTNEIKLAAKAA